MIAITPSSSATTPGLFQLAAENGIRMLPAAIQYAERDDAWIDDDPFVSHFMRGFGRSRMAASLQFGPVLDPGDPMELESRYEDWIRQALCRPVREFAAMGAGRPAALRPA